MRLLQVTVPTGKRETVLAALDDEGVDYVLSDETSKREYEAVVSVPLPTPAVEPVLEALREAGIERDAYTVVLDAETVVSKDFEALAERYAEEQDEDRIAREELEAAARDLVPGNRTFLVMTVVSAVIATAGLLLDSPAVVVGSMVIAPLIGPAMAASVGTVVDEQDLFERGVWLQVVGLTLSMVAAGVFAFVLREASLVPPALDITTVPEIRERLAPDVLSLAVALGAGVAGALSLTAGVSSAIVGVMIAVALLPPAATVGIGLAWGLPMVALGAGVLALVNGLSINLAALVVLWTKGYRPDRWFKLDEAREATIKRMGALLVAIVLLSVFLGAVTYTGVRTAEFERTVDEQVGRTLDNGEYPDLERLSVEVRYGEDPIFRTPEQVVVTVGRPTDREYPDLAQRLRERIRSTTGRQVRVQVRFVDIDEAGGS